MDIPRSCRISRTAPLMKEKWKSAHGYKNQRKSGVVERRGKEGTSTNHLVKDSSSGLTVVINRHDCWLIPRDRETLSR
ncbi:hypothetical protein CSUI_005732 [Cystoisospora suis]|uniref:Uncharacterized protein n=1 Tax=Cystoisospora suis TaxID=483139 RepID=A0A2C6KU72_9APIC|nr:hypothetical protein CSUI_005732 [Cystoisospora suis]